MNKLKSIVTIILTVAALFFGPPPCQAQVLKKPRAIADSIQETSAVTYSSARRAAGGLAFSTATLTSNGTNVSNNDTVTVGAKAYTFKTSLTPTEGEVLIGGSASASLLNLIRAINHTGTPDTDYKCAVAHTEVSAASAVTSNAFLITALSAGKAGDSLASTEAAATLSFAYTTFTGGGEVALDTDTSSVFSHTLAATNRTINIKGNFAGRHTLLLLKQDGTGSRTVIWDTNIRWSGGTAPTLTTTAGRTDVIEFVDTGTYYLGRTYALNFSES